MTDSLRRISTMFLRYLYLHKRSLPRTLELVFWPVTELLVWGFLTIYVQTMVEDSVSQLVVFLINAMIFWDILYRSQQGVTISIMEEIWHQNLMNLLVSPLRLWEWLMATFLYGMLKSLVITLILTVIAILLYHFNMVTSLGFALIPLAANLLLFGWALGVFTSAILLRWGYAAEALIWGIPFLVQPLSAIYYPLSVLPNWIQPISRCLPSTYVFEGMRAVLNKGIVPYAHYFAAFALNAVFFLVGAVFFNWLFKSALSSGRLVRLGMD
ncbi:MAG: ABC transporter permease [Candidatus Omnitrophota bacterium]|nr:ABC transporter permease [Candidatus Omnitrophota bacterium]